eukprot:TRINITY_DN52690_c0_g1_i1.p1 TRINITY_DN52690_c0_g1~~TRINITY_DN52690_c0_g1_i1.p1  ORF type:complete len:132 (+),score=42.91 TRINITY_DN52690_c0_g1_i1:39-434(+)
MCIRDSCEVVVGSTPCDAKEFAALLPGVELHSSGGVLTTFNLDKAQVEAAFGDLIKTLKVQTWSRPRSFQKSWKTGSTEISINSAEGKYSKGTSVLTLKFNCLLYTSDAADEEDSVEHGGRRIIKKKKKRE